MIKVLSKVVAFDWDKGNFDKNLKKHDVSSQEAEEIFYNEPIVYEDFKHSKEESRFQALGRTDKGRSLLISSTIRKNKIRIISARDMNKKEVLRYEKA